MQPSREDAVGGSRSLLMGPKQVVVAATQQPEDLKVPGSREGIRMGAPTTLIGTGDLESHRSLHTSQDILHASHARISIPDRIPPPPSVAPPPPPQQPRPMTPTKTTMTMTDGGRQYTSEDMLSNRNEIRNLEENLRDMEGRVWGAEADTRSQRHQNDHLSKDVQSLRQTLLDRDNYIDHLKRSTLQIRQELDAALQRIASIPPPPPPGVDPAVHDAQVRGLEERAREREGRCGELERKCGEMERRIETLIRENDVLVEHGRSVEREGERLRAIVERQGEDNRAMSSHVHELQQTLHQLSTSLQSTTDSLRVSRSEVESARNEADLLQAEVDRLSGELKKAAMGTREDRRRIAELRRAIDEVVGRYQKAVEEAFEVAEREKALIVEVRSLEVENKDLTVKVGTAQQQLGAAKEENEELMRLSKSFEARVVELQDSEAEGFKKIQDAINKAEEATLERDKCVLREQQLQSEIDRLKETAADTAQRIRQKAEADGASMRAQFGQDRRKFAEQVSGLETTLASVQAMLERAIREKRAAESELEKTSKFIPEEGERLNRMVEDMATRLRISERERFEAVEMAGRFDNIPQEDEIKHLSKLTQLEHDHEALQTEKQQLIQSHEAELTSLIGKHDLHVNELTSQIHLLNEAHTRTSRELQHLLSTQQAASLRWKSDQVAQTRRFEEALSEVRSQLGRAVERCEQLEETVRGLSKARREVGMCLDEERRGSERLRCALRVAEERGEEMVRRTEELARRERDWMVEKKHLQRDIDRFQLEKERISREVAQVKQEASRAFKMRNQVINLKAEIDRVKNRSRLRTHHQTVERQLSRLDDDDDDSDDDDEIGHDEDDDFRRDLEPSRDGSLSSEAESRRSRDASKAVRRSPPKTVAEDRRGMAAGGTVDTQQ
ncbi:hypothetical protein HK101_007313 [Irineochytrium annulatum]|nr:hypothetical protein HK101_007313 [Irineochytrium annulatum]